MKKPGLKAGYGQQVFDRLSNLEGSFKKATAHSKDEIDTLKKRISLFEEKISGIDFLNIARNGSCESAQDIDVLRQNSVLNLVLNPILNPGPTLTYSTDFNTVKDDTNIQGTMLPSESQIRMLIDIYFESVNPIFPILCPTNTIPKLLEQSRDGSKPLLLGVILCSLRFASSIISREEVKKYHTYCKGQIISTCIGMCNIEQLQAMTLLTFDLFGKSNNPETWSFISLISSGVVHLNLTKERRQTQQIVIPSPDQETQKDHTKQLESRKRAIKNVKLLKSPIDWFEEESRRRLFWEIYILDKLSSVSNSFPFKIPESEIDCLFPVEYDSWIADRNYRNDTTIRNSQRRILSDGVINANMLNDLFFNDNIYDSSCFLIELIHILGKVHTFMRHPIDIQSLKDVLNWQMKFSEIDNEIQNWRKTVPQRYLNLVDNDSFDKPLAIKDVLFHALYHATIIRLNSAAGFPYFHSNYFLSSEEARFKSLQSANHILSFSKKLPQSFSNNEHIYELCGPQYAFAIWVTARLILVNAINYGNKMPQELDYLIDLLSKIGGIWESSKKYSEILNFLKMDKFESTVNDLNFMRLSEGSQNLNMYDGKIDDNDNDDDDDDDDDVVSDANQLSQSQHLSKSARIISDMRLNAYIVDVILSKKIEKFKQNESKVSTNSPHNQNDFSNIFEWFKLPIAHEFNVPFIDNDGKDVYVDASQHRM